MKTLSLLTATLFLILPACKDAKPRTRNNIPIAVEHAPKQDPAPHPYYYGLIEEYRTTLAADPQNLAALIGLGNAYSDSGSWRDAIIQYEQALKIDPRNADVHTDLGTAFRNLGMTERAMAQYRKALEYEPTHLNARYNLGIVYGFELRNYPLAVHIWQEVLRIAPNHPQAEQMRSSIVSFKKMMKKGHP